VPVAARTYDELRLRFESRQPDGYWVHASAPRGEASGPFALPFADVEIENFILRASRTLQTHRRIETAQTEHARAFGERLFGALFHDRIRDIYQGALADADRSGHGLRIMLSLTNTPELMDLPWEFLYDEPNFLAISVMTPVVRYLDLPRPRRPLTIEPPLRILAMVSSPADAALLDTNRERANLERALAGLIDAGHVELRWTERATLNALLQELRTETYHVFHYVGHGVYDHDVEDGVLLLEDEDWRGRPVTGTELGTILHDCRSLRLAVLNACEGARTARDDPFAGVAASLVQREIPAVIAMQFDITDAAAVVFAEGFYEAIAAGFPVDAALAEARKSIFADHHDIEWGTPVLFMRVADGKIFDLPRDSAAARASPLALDLSVTPSPATAGELVTWRLRVQNLGSSSLSSLSVIDGEGHRLGEPTALDGGATHALSWRSNATTDTDQTVTAGAETPRGERVSGQATAHLTVREPRAPDVRREQATTSRPMARWATALRRDRRILGLCLLGTGMLVAGFLFPGSQATVATSLIVAGAAAVAIGVLLPRIDELTVGPGRLEMTPPVSFVAGDERLSRFGHLMCGDAAQARELAEEALGIARLGRRTADERGPIALRALIDLLETAEERRWLHGKPKRASGTPPEIAPIIEALGELDFIVRVEFLLRVDWALRVEDVAALLDRSVDMIRHDVATARELLRPHIEQRS
jgi:DNA-directed RNA polymerase specialized sigma24 family protein